jgi:hypothetical protein
MLSSIRPTSQAQSAKKGTTQNPPGKFASAAAPLRRLLRPPRPRVPVPSRRQPDATKAKSGTQSEKEKICKSKLAPQDWLALHDSSCSKPRTAPHC